MSGNRLIRLLNILNGFRLKVLSRELRIKPHVPCNVNIDKFYRQRDVCYSQNTIRQRGGLICPELEERQ